VSIEISVLANIIEAGNAPVPKFLGKLLTNAPESFDDQRAGEIAAIVRTMRNAGEPISFADLLPKCPAHSDFISSELASAVTTADDAKFQAEKCWKAFQTRQAISICDDAAQGLRSAPDKAPSIIDITRSAFEELASESENGLPEPVDAVSFIAEPLEEPPVLVDGLLHKGSKLVLGGSSKSFKTWSLLDLALSVATGSTWIDRQTSAGKVLFVNFEIQPCAWQRRILAVAGAKGIELAAGQIVLWNLRGYGADFRELVPKVIQKCRGQDFALIVLDPIYKLYGKTDENAAGDVAALLNSLESLATETGAAIAFGAHFAKGNASGKEAIDRISGSGVFARDPDSLLIFTKHETDDAFTVEPILRNFAPVAPFAVRWEFPLMHLSADLDPAKLKQTGGRKPTHLPEDLLALLPPEGLTNSNWLAKAAAEGVSKATFYRLRKDLQIGRKIHFSTITDKFQPILSK